MAEAFSNASLFTEFEKNAIKGALESAAPTEAEMNAQERLGYSDDEAERLKEVRQRRREREAREQIEKSLLISGRSERDASDLADRLITSNDVWDMDKASTSQFGDTDESFASASGSAGGISLNTSGYIVVNGVVTAGKIAFRAT